MQKDNLYSEILTYAKTTRELNLLSEELDLLEGSLFRGEAGSFDSALASDVREEVASAIRNLLKNSGLDKGKLISDVKLEIANLTHLKITMAYEPDSSVISMIYTWAKENIAEKFVLDINSDPKILGGALISWKGKYGDFSLRRKFEESFSYAGF